MAWLGKGRRHRGPAGGRPGLAGVVGAGLVRCRRVRSAARRPSARCARGRTISAAQARALFHHSVPGERERLARRVARWLRSRGLSEVSREQVRTEALGRRVDATEADQVLYRLQVAGVLQQVLYTAPLRGRPPNRWWVNPRLTPRSLPEIPGMPESPDDDSNAVSGPRRAVSARIELGERPRRVVEHGAEGRHQQPAERLLVAQPAAALPVRSMMKACSPSKMPGSSTRPSQRNSRSGRPRAPSAGRSSACGWPAGP